MYFPNFKEIERAIFFSFAIEPTQPPSLPPCPASITTVLMPKKSFVPLA